MGGKPSKHTPADMRLKANKRRAAKRAAAAPVYSRPTPPSAPPKR